MQSIFPLVIPIQDPLRPFKKKISSDGGDIFSFQIRRAFNQFLFVGIHANRDCRFSFCFLFRHEQILGALSVGVNVMLTGTYFRVYSVKHTGPVKGIWHNSISFKTSLSFAFTGGRRGFYFGRSNMRSPPIKISA